MKKIVKVEVKWNIDFSQFACTREELEEATCLGKIWLQKIYEVRRR